MMDRHMRWQRDRAEREQKHAERGEHNSYSISIQKHQLEGLGG